MTVGIMSDKELSRLEVPRDLDQQRLTAAAAADILRLSRRQVLRLLKAYRTRGVDGPISEQRGRPSNRRQPVSAIGRLDRRDQWTAAEGKENLRIRPHGGIDSRIAGLFRLVGDVRGRGQMVAPMVEMVAPPFALATTVAWQAAAAAVRQEWILPSAREADVPHRQT